MKADFAPVRKKSQSPDCSLSRSLIPSFRSCWTFRSSYFRNFYVLLLLILLLAILLCVSLTVLMHRWRKQPRPVFHPLRSFDHVETIILQPPLPESSVSSSHAPSPTDHNCLFHHCFNVYRCGRDDHNKIKVYIYPLYDYVTAHDDHGAAAVDHLPVTPSPMSKEYHEILSAIHYSEYITKNPDEACLFLPSIDLLNQNRVMVSEAGRVLASLPFWKQGSNHLIFNIFPGLAPDKESFPDIKIGRSLVAGGSFSSWTFRRNYDISIPVFNPLVTKYFEAKERREKYRRSSHASVKRWLASSSQINIHPEYRDALTRLAQDHSDFLVLGRCDEAGHNTVDQEHREALNLTRRCSSTNAASVHYYPHVLEEATFCLVLRGSRLGQAALGDAMASGCIPVVVIDHYVLPFEDVIDWQRAAVRLYEGELSNLLDILHNISPERIDSMQRQISFLWSKYFKSPSVIALTTLQIINDRVFPYTANSYDEWNQPKAERGSSAGAAVPPMGGHSFFPLVHSPKRSGFTAVILTYDRTNALFKLVQRIAHTESLAKIVVIWNNQNKRPPPPEDWPKLTKPLVVRETRANVLGNRFHPYDDIETEAVLALDDDINMLTTDELEFAYQVWSEHPDRLVGFPARLHAWDANLTMWKYDSEWMNEISMVLTGAAFYHKHFSYLYSTAMPGDIRTWVDNHMNCEDIAMNFLIANYTGKAPIKVTPRKKFKCPNCPVNSLSYATEHMVERSKCINYFAGVYGAMPLKTVEFRADPVLYMDNVPTAMKKFNGVGSL